MSLSDPIKNAMIALLLKEDSWYIFNNSPAFYCFEEDTTTDDFKGMNLLKC